MLTLVSRVLLKLTLRIATVASLVSSITIPLSATPILAAEFVRSNLRPRSGGTLTLVGLNDVYNLDTVSAYESINYDIGRLWTRQLVTYADGPTLTAEEKLIPDVATQVPTVANGGITDGGRTYTFHIRRGVMWNSVPPRQVTADDFLREFKTLCNPASPVGAPAYFEGTIVGMSSYCAGFAKVKPTATAIASYESSHALPGVSAPNNYILVIHLMHSAPDFLNIIAMPFCSARPIEYMKFVPDSRQLRQHLMSDGPYEIQQYTPDKGFVFVRNPAWRPSTQPFVHAYVNKVVITEGLSAVTVQEELQAGTADLDWDVQPPSQDLPSLYGSPDLVIFPPGQGYLDLQTYLVMNLYSGPTRQKLVREAIAVAINKRSVAQLYGGLKVAAPANQMILPGNTGYIPGYNPFPENNGNGNPGKAKALLAQAGYPHGIRIKLMYYTLGTMPRVAAAIEASLALAGIRVVLVPETITNFYGSYLYNPSVAKRGVWNVATPGWSPDWFGDNGRSTLVPLLTYPGPGSSDYSGYDNPVFLHLVNEALTASTEKQAANYWAAADRQALGDAVVVPVVMDKWYVYHSSQVQNCIFWWPGLNCDLGNVWLSR
jgi:ABC-type transport system substrate-binding protein